MPANAASRSIGLPGEMEKDHTVLFLVYTRLAMSSAEALKPHLPEHLKFIKGLRERGVLALAGPFFTPDGKNSGDGVYALQVDSLEAAEEIAGEDPLHKRGLRTPTVLPWAKEDK